MDGWANIILEEAAQMCADRLNASSQLRLFVNNYTPDAGSTIADFTECSATGYSAIDMSGEWGAVSQIADGKYRFDGNAKVFTTTDVAPVSVYGCWVDDAVDVLLVLRFVVLQNFSATSPIAVQLRPYECIRGFI